MKKVRGEHFGAPSAAVIVAHPDDETLWAGGAMLGRPDVDWFVMTLCRASDPDRAPRFGQVLKSLHARGRMADLDDGPDQTPLPGEQVERTILACLPAAAYDLIVTHGPAGEYTRHRRHEEVCRAVVALWQADKLTAREVWLFAYEDGGRRYLPRVQTGAHLRKTLPDGLWREKYRLVTEVYGFPHDSWEARTTPRQEGFWRFESAEQAARWVAERMGVTP